MKYAIFVDTRDCVGCYACEVACKQEHNLPVGPRLIRVGSNGPRLIEGKLQLRYEVEHCRHCAPARCVEHCPKGAITTRPDGITVISPELCDACKLCAKDCTFGMMQFDEIKKAAYKCDLCVERLDQGLKPACVAACPSRCIYFGDKKEISRKAGRKKN
ncbi:MAG: 4Fe-4S ferredoxin [Chloroflexi bacterium]|jgi:Fe-S-cluster-containing dehydrogenase component|nr:4Fe-4S ferredoxin [Chloroflexota bacterium]